MTDDNRVDRSAWQNPGSDRLAHLLRRQRKLQETSFGTDFKGWTQEDRIEYIKMNVLALTDELHEVLNEVGWKPWATSRHVNEIQAFDELVDALHFLMNLLLAVQPDLSSDVLAALVLTRYESKHATNAARQRNGYDGTSTKCPGCSRALDDRGTIQLVDLVSSKNDAFETRYKCTGCDYDLLEDFTNEELRQLLVAANGGEGA